MKTVTLGSTGITVPQNGFGALPIQRIDKEAAAHLLRKAYDGGMRFFDTANAYSDSEEKMGYALADVRQDIFLATKTGATTPAGMREHIENSLRMLKTDYVDILQFHCAPVCYKPDDGTGMYECMEALKQEGKIRHIAITAHKIDVAIEAIESGLYETLQYPISYLSTPKELALIDMCVTHNMGFIGMKGLAGGLLTRSDAAMAFATQFDNFVPIWGIQREAELDEWLSYMDNTPVMTDEIKAFIEADKAQLGGDFCRSCGYCMPCPQGIQIFQCARMSQMIRRAPSAAWTTAYWQKEMARIDDCLHCGKCAAKCPYELNTPELLRKNLEDYRNILEGKTKV
ncbi:MAG: aldo/keto reductase [Lachnospiraceae bacterium]|nr:aldo/keto reductase [Lachnospiraceae bacterium]